MLLNTIAENHPNSFVLLLPKTRDEQNRVRDWQVLNTSRHYDEILKVAKYYRAEGMNDAVICSTIVLTLHCCEFSVIWILYYKVNI